MRRLNKQDMEDLLSGALILGCGGGGDPRAGKELIEEAYRRRKGFYVVDLNEVDDEGIYCLISYVGGGISEDEEVLVKGLKKVTEHPILQAAQELSGYLGKEFSVIFDICHPRILLVNG